MTDLKKTIRGLECCVNVKMICRSCPYMDKEKDDCNHGMLMEDALDLIFDLEKSIKARDNKIARLSDNLKALLEEREDQDED